MYEPFGPDSRRDLVRRGFTRRDFGRLARLADRGCGHCRSTTRRRWPRGFRRCRNFRPMPFGSTPTKTRWAPAPRRSRPSTRSSRRGAGISTTRRSRSWTLLAEVEGVPRDHVMPFAGSSDPLHRAVLAYTGPGKSYVVADPGYEAGERAARVHRCQGDFGSACGKTMPTMSTRWRRPTPTPG